MERIVVEGNWPDVETWVRKKFMELNQKGIDRLLSGKGEAPPVWTTLNFKAEPE